MHLAEQQEYDWVIPVLLAKRHKSTLYGVFTIYDTVLCFSMTIIEPHQNQAVTFGS